ncbi:B12-binding domain-containing radical SAM protein [Actinomadura sp. ATCC 31491]|uniref:B12-binding domain-containing radical SAM protein n=1 Tax=Actinomadura luzonensis TaxID=2805427 RepID=A0ABT0FSR0_9ACTN|nr:radical SAM protein [Actinomadura luzonensis]MCK2215378.1 B12-binding domain-containing radical SAM protein [Actinomadura luzonensis]
MRILLVNMPTPPKESFGRRSQPLGVAYLAAYLLERGHDVEIHEGNGAGGGMDALVERCLSAEAGLIGFSSTTPSFPLVGEAAARYRAAGGRALLVAGGHHVSAVLPTAVLAEVPELDAVVTGEGEQTLGELVEAHERGAGLAGIRGLSWRDGDDLRWNGSRKLLSSLESLPLPARHLLPPLSEYAGVRRWPTLDVVPCATIAASRGCPYRCSFCDIQSFYRREDGPMRRVRRPESVAEEMAMVNREYGAEHFAFVDDLFPYAPGWVQRFSDALVAAGKPGTFSFAARADHVVKHPGLLAALAAGGCSSIEMGIESGSQSVLDRYRKDLSVEVNLQAIRLIHDSGIRTIIDYIMFDPWSTPVELAESLDFLEAAGADAGYPTTAYSRLTFYPGTPLYDRWAAGPMPDPDDPEWFENRDVHRVWAALGAFRDRAQQRVNDEIEAWRHIHRGAVQGGDEELRGAAVRQMYALRRLPHRALRELVNLTLKGGLDDDGSAEVVRRSLAVLDASAAGRGDLAATGAGAGRDADRLLSACE